MTYLVGFSDKHVSTSFIHEGSILSWMITNTNLETDCYLYSLENDGTELYVVEADNPIDATEKAIRLFRRSNETPCLGDEQL